MMVGVDVSKASLTACIHGSSPQHYPNTIAGHKALLSALQPGSEVAVESTGIYHLPLVHFLQQNGLVVYVVNPYQVKSFASAILNRNKTDSLDAETIAEYAWLLRDKLVPYAPLSDEHYIVRWLVSFAEGLTVNAGASTNRLHAMSITHPELASTLDRVVFDLNTIRNSLYDRAERYVVDSVELSAKAKALESIPGIGRRSAIKILAYSGDITRFRSEKAYAAFTGLTPKLKQSGAFNGSSHISRAGNPRLRAVYHMCAYSASRSKSAHGEYYRRLVKAGKPKMSALTALAHRIARHAWRVCNPRKPS